MSIGLKFDPEVDAVYFYLADSKIFESEELSPGIVCDYDENNNVVGIEVLNVRTRTPEEFTQLSSSLNSPLTPVQKAMFRDFFAKVPAL